MASKKIYYLSSCDTCRRIMKDIGVDTTFEQQDIKTDKITDKQLTEMAKLSGSYESLFSRKAIKYKALGLAEKTLTEQDYKKYILEEYTFLKRPVIIVDSKIFVGNVAATIQAVKEALAN